MTQPAGDVADTTDEVATAISIYDDVLGSL